MGTYLKRDVRVELKFGHLVSPGHEAFRLLVDVVVEHMTCSRELDGFEFITPPLGKLTAPVNQLQNTN